MTDVVPVAVVEDHVLYRSMLLTSLATREDIRVAMTATSAADVRAKFVPGAARVVIVALGMRLLRT